MNSCIEILRKLNEKPLKLKLSNTFYVQLSTARINEDKVYIDALCIAISNFEIAYTQSGNFQNTIRTLSDENIDRVLPIIEWYINYGDLLKLLLNYNNALNSEPLKKIAYNLTKDKYGSSIMNISWALENFSDIVQKIFNSDERKELEFLNRINGWEKYFRSSPNEINQRVFKHLDKQNLNLVKKITQKSLEYFEALSKDDYLNTFKNPESLNYIIFEALVNNKLITSFNDIFYSAYNDFLKGISRGEIEIPKNISIWDELIDILNGRKLRTYFTSLRDYFIDHDDMSRDEIYFFERGLFKYGNLNKKSDGISLKFILPMIKDDDCFDCVFLDNWDNIKLIISKTTHKESILGELKTQSESIKFKDNTDMVSIKQELEL